LRPLFILLISTLLAASAAHATDDARLKDYILTGLEYSYQEDYDSARTCFQRAIKEYPDDPAGHFFLCGLYGLYMSDFSTDDVEGLYLINLFEATRAAEKRIRADSTDGWAHFYMGGAYGYRAYREQEKGSIWSAFKYALTAVSELKKSVACDSTIYDAYMGIGSFHYFINYLWARVPFLGRDPDKGIGEIKLAVDRGVFVNVPAQDGLVYILLRERRFDEALGMAKNLLARYPNSRTFHWTMAKVYEDTDDWDSACATYRELSSLIEAGQPQNYYNQAYCGEKLTYCLYMDRKYDESLDVCKKSLDILKRGSDHKRTDELQKSLNGLLKDIQKARAAR
jgi:tetratricopeptide (TPR) repeat protein